MKDNTMGFDASIACFIDKHTGGVICLKEMDKVEEIALPSITTGSMIDKEKFTSYLFQALGVMDIVISNIALRGMGSSIKILFNIKDGAKSTALNVSNENLSAIENIALGIGTITISVIVGIVAGEGILAVSASILIGVLLSAFLVKFYLYLKDNALELWEKIKVEFDSITANIALLIENNISSLQDFTSNIARKISSWVEEFDVNASMIQSGTSSGAINYNPTHPYANPKRNLESKDYQSLIALLLDTNSTAKDIDSLLHSFPHYLQDSKQPLESNTTASTPTQSNTESTTPTAQSNKQAKDSNNSTTPKNNNPNTKNTNTFPFSLSIKDYNTFTPLQNKTIQLTNIDSKLTYTKQQKVSNAKECFR